MLLRPVLFFFSLVLVLSACKDYPNEQVPMPKKVAPVDTNSLYQFTASVEGVNFNLYSTLNSYTNLTSNIKTTATPPDSPTIVYASTITRPGNFANSLTVRKGILKHPGLSPTEPEFENFFATGSYPFTTALQGNEGIAVEWTDENGKVWSTAFGDQTGSEFVVQATDKDYLSGVTVLYVRCIFLCKVYDQSGNHLLIESGKFYGIFKNN